MGELEKEKGAWGYVEGGMGGVSRAIASSARSLGVDIFTEKVILFRYIVFLSNLQVNEKKKTTLDLFPWQDVEQIQVGSDGAARGVVLTDGTEVNSKVVLSNATPYVTFRRLTPQVLQRNRKHHVALAKVSWKIHFCLSDFRVVSHRSSSRLWIRLTTPPLSPKSMVNCGSNGRLLL